MIDILHIITSLDSGGAEQALYNLLKATDGSHFRQHVIGLRGMGAIGRQVGDLGIPVQALNMSPGVPKPGAVKKLARQVEQIEPALVQTWMYHADLLGAYACRSGSKPRLVWGIHHADLSLRNNKFSTLAVAKLDALLSHRLPDRIITPSRIALEAHVRFGYDRGRMVHIPNGFDLSRFKPDNGARESLRAELGLAGDIRLVCMAARYHPLKDHGNFIRAAALLSAKMPQAHFILCGRDVNWENHALADMIRSAGLAERFHLLGVRQDMPRIFNGLDVGTLTSLSEAFPSVVGEMMACGLPCAVTDAGDAAEIIGDAGLVTAVGDSPALAAAWERLLRLNAPQRNELGNAARQRVVTHYGIDRMADRYRALYEELLDRSNAP
ncbi:MAG: glycosyltransferase [Anaerolineae bacterium]|nr:glycosyltransferase [Anaerolineae bacterium]